VVDGDRAGIGVVGGIAILGVEGVDSVDGDMGCGGEPGWDSGTVEYG
jgi:hypothetical protein